MGTGSTDTANAMTVIGPHEHRAAEPDLGRVAECRLLPRAPLEPAGRWSLSAGSSATQLPLAPRCASTGTARLVRCTEPRRRRLRPADPGLADARPSPASGTYRVVVQRHPRTATSQHRSSTSYTVRLFTPTS